MTSISVLMPVHNGMPYIQEAVQSVLTQNFQHWELIISDNGSTDGTRDYLDTLNDSRIRVYKQEINLGIMDNLNFLFERANASVAKVLCADDFLLAGALERTLRFMEERPNCAVSRCLAKGNASPPKRRSASRYIHEYQESLPTHLEPAAAFLAYVTFGNPVGNPSQAACRPNLILSSGGFDQSYPHAGDREAWARITRTYGLELQNEELVFERTHPQQNRNFLNRNNASFPERARFLKAWAEEIPRNDLADLKLVKRHWTIHQLSWALPSFIRRIKAGQLRVVREMLQDLPLGILPTELIAAYPIWKFNLPPAQSTIRQLFGRILELNGGTDQFGDEQCQVPLGGCIGNRI